MEQLHAYREKLKSRISLLRQEIERAGITGNSLTLPSADDELYELVSLLNDLLNSERKTPADFNLSSHDSSQNARWVWDPDNNTVNVSEGLMKLLGVEGNVPISTLEEILKPVFYSDREKVQNTLRECYKEGKPFNLYYRITKADNTMRFIHSRGKILRNSSGAPQKMAATVKDVTEQVIEENKFDILFYSSPDAIIITDENGRIREWNKKASEFFGYEPHEATGAEFCELMLAGEHRDNFRSLISEHILSRDTSLFDRKTDLQAVRSDGTEFPAELTISSIRLESSHLLLLFIRDISEQRNGEDMLREKEELYRTVVESLFEGLIITDTADRITFVNKQFEKLSGYTREELAGRIEYEIFHSPSYHESIRNRMKSRLAGQCETYELPFTRKDGTTFMARVNAAPFRNAAGEIIGTVGAISDITAQKREAELEQLVIAATKSFNSVLITDRQGLIEWTNEGFTKLTGYTLEDVKGTRGEILRRSEERGIANQQQLLSELQKRKEALTYESRSFTKSGTEFWTITTLTPVLNENNEVEKIISIDSDITLRKKMEEQLKLANKIAENSLIKGNRALSELTLAKQTLEETMRAKEQFLAHISHEIRTPMNGIIGLTDLLLKGSLTKEQREFLLAIKRSGDTLMVVINDILDLSKIEAGKMTFEEIPFKLNNTINSLFDLFMPKAKEKQIKLIKNISSNFPEVLLGDPVRLNQIIMNLVSNAVKFTEQGYVEVAATLENQTQEHAYISIKVKDTGPGIPEEQMNTLFLDFTQARTDITRKYGGTGLGLSIAKKLVELQGGTVSVKSAIGAGSEFTIHLTLKKLSEGMIFTENIAEEDTFDHKALNGANVLLVEDNPVNQLLAEKLLSDWGCNISVADNGRIALEKLHENNYDLILMDIKMPEMDGYEATKRIRQLNGKARNIPIIALTAHAAMWEAEKCIESGMNGYISKPFNIKELYKMISGNLNNMNEDEASQNRGNHKYTDLTFLKSIAKGSNEFMNKIINSFIKQTGEEIKNMQVGLAHKDWEAVHGSAHKIKPSLHFVGITELKDPILALEKSSKERVNLEGIPSLVQKIVDICNKAIDELKEELDKMNTPTKND